MMWSDRDRRAVLLGAAGLALVLSMKFILLPWLHHWGEARADIVRHRAVLADVEHDLERLDFLHSRLKPGYGEAVARPLENVSTTLLMFDQTIQKSLTDSGVALQTKSHRGARTLREAQGVVLVTIQVQARGDLAALARCLNRMRHAEQLVIVDQLTLHTPDPNRPGQLAYTMELSTPALEGAEP